MVLILESTKLAPTPCKLSEDWKFPPTSLVELRSSDSLSGTKVGTNEMPLHADKLSKPWVTLQMI